jgi:hypothetical protein
MRWLRRGKRREEGCGCFAEKILSSFLDSKMAARGRKQKACLLK